MMLGTYLYWHYFIAPIEILKLLRNYTIFTWRKFLIWGHTKTLFAPWHKIRLQDVVGPQNFINRLASIPAEIYIRILAACLRLTLICAGLIIEAMLIAFFIGFSIAWLAWPILVVFAISRGLKIAF